MDIKKKGLLPRIEILIIIVFFLSFIVWAVSKCKTSKALQQQAAELENATPAEDSLPKMQPSLVPLPKNENAIDAAGAAQTDKQPELSRLYITIDGLKLRTGPSLDSTVIYEFKLFDEVYFMNEVTDFTTPLSLGKEMADEPWVKVKNSRGKTGWVYGAGVHYHKKKREGVQ